MVKGKENSEFKPIKLHLKNRLYVSFFMSHVEGYVG